jgi:phage terminase large subunit-like protein
MLSNTAVPKYYGEFRDAVIAGEIPVNQNVSMEMNRIDYLIDNPDFYYDDEAVERFIRFCENEMVLTDGSDLVLLDSFKLWAEQDFGWYYFIDIKIWDPDAHGAGRGGYITKQKKKRLVNKQYLIVGRGAAKSLYASCIQAYFLNCDVSTTDQIVTAPTMRLSEEIVNPIGTAITKARGDLFKFLTEGSLQNTTGSKKDRQKLASTKKGIQNFLTNSIIRILPMSIDKLQGLRCKIATVDEWLSGVIKEDPIGAIEQGASKLDDYLIIATSSEGTVRNGAGDAMKIELMKILKGEYYNPHVSIWWYRLDDISEIADPFMWVKANPNIGKTVSYETYQLDVERAENSPAARNDIIAKRFGIPMEGFTFFFTYEETICHGRQSYDGMQCAMGADLSQGGDFCSFAFLFPLPNGAFGIKTINYISEYTKSTLNLAMRQKYESFEKEGSLVVMPGTILKMDDVYDDLDEYIQRHEYDIRAFGYDPYNSTEFVTRWIRENGEWAVQKVIQGAKTESVPLTEIKKLAEQRLWVFDEELYSYTMGNCMILMDTNGNKKLLKQVYEAKIDAVAASMDAFVAYKINVDSFD